MGGNTKLNLGSWVLMSLTLMAPVVDAAAEPVSSRMDAYRVSIAADGKEKLEAAEAVKPGDVLEYQVTYSNTEAKPVSELQVNVSVPEGTAYVDGSAKTAVKSEVRFSADDGKTFKAAPLKQAMADGKGEETVPADRYSNIRWLAAEPLVMGSAQKYSYRVRVSDAQ